MEQLLINVILLSLCCWALLHTFTVKAKVDAVADDLDRDTTDIAKDIAHLEMAYDKLIDEMKTTEDIQIEKLAKKYTFLAEMYMNGCHFDGMTDSQRDSIKEYTEYLLKSAMYGLLHPELEE